MRAPSKNWALKISTLVVVTACFVVMGAALLISQNFKHLLTLWGEDVQMTIYLSQDLSDKGRLEIEEKIKATGKVADIKLINQEQALGDFRVQLASYAPDVAQDDELLKLIPSSLQVRLAGDISVENQMPILKELAVQIKDLEGVDEVSYGQDWVEKYASLVTALQMMMRILGLVIVGAALFVISNVIRASIHSRKEEIVVLEMIGATPFMIRKPFMIEGATLGFVSSLAALFFCYVIFIATKSVFINKLSFLQMGQHLQFLSVGAVVFFAIGGLCLGAFASYLCVRRLNDGFAGSQG